jgi:putative methyltransferase (TIGR04325 family)
MSVVSSLIWGVVEQEHYVRCGREQFETDQLKFFYTIDECTNRIRPNVALLSSVLQYVRDPYAILSQLIETGISHLVIDRTPFASGNADFITVQHVPASIYSASYPCRVFGEQSFLNRLQDRFEIIARFDGFDGKAAVRGLEFAFGGVILHRT